MGPYGDKIPVWRPLRWQAIALTNDQSSVIYKSKYNVCIHQNAFQTSACKMATSLFRHQYFK